MQSNPFYCVSFQRLVVPISHQQLPITLKLLEQKKFLFRLPLDLKFKSVFVVFCVMHHLQ